MPTGYTSDVQDGKVTNFREFATNCARAFGANILMRDDPMDAPIREYEPAAYKREWLEQAQAKVFDLERMTVEQAAKLQAKENADRAKALGESLAKMRQGRDRYQAMLAKVNAWKPPTPEHEGLKKFMVEQLTTSIDHDCYDPTDYYKPDTRTPEEYLRAEIDDAKKDVERQKKGWEEEIERTNGRNDWNRQLFDSLKDVK